MASCLNIISPGSQSGYSLTGCSRSSRIKAILLLILFSLTGNAVSHGELFPAQRPSFVLPFVCWMSRGVGACNPLRAAAPHAGFWVQAFGLCKDAFEQYWPDRISNTQFCAVSVKCSLREVQQMVFNMHSLAHTSPRRRAGQ